MELESKVTQGDSASFSTATYNAWRFDVFIVFPEWTLAALSLYIAPFFLFCSPFIRRRLRQPDDDERKNSSIPLAEVMKCERTKTPLNLKITWMDVNRTHNNKEDACKVIHRPWNLSSKSVSRVSYRDKWFFFRRAFGNLNGFWDWWLREIVV